MRPPLSPTKDHDGDGLYLCASAIGFKSWRFDCKFEGKRKTLTMGSIPSFLQKEARKKLGDAKLSLQTDIAPRLRKKGDKEAARAESVNSFEVVARERFARKRTGQNERRAQRIWARLEKDFRPFLANRSICEITSQEVWEVLRKTEARGTADASRKRLQ
ncbi:MAG: integrase arm-type DNA-binding domain-containing protein [Deltaproteobacteria bacterium]|nr:integrase arm-type DNA-binding domain-containing protein [Deltaproteobacteria bacterium]